MLDSLKVGGQDQGSRVRNYTLLDGGLTMLARNRVFVARDRPFPELF